MSTDEIIKPVSEWGAVSGRYVLTVDQKRRKRKGQSIYVRDRVVAPYTVSKGEFV